jgi:hypothetical protein
MASKSVTRVERGYSSEQLYRLSGLALLAALPLQIVGYLLHPPNEEVQQVLQATYGPARGVVRVVAAGAPGAAWAVRVAGTASRAARPRRLCGDDGGGVLPLLPPALRGIRGADHGPAAGD